MTGCLNCDHPVAFHGGDGCWARYLVSDPICGCVWHEGNQRLEPPVQCRAEYHSSEDWKAQCEIMIPEGVAHDGNHRTEHDSWSENQAFYPGPGAAHVANPERTQVTKGSFTLGPGESIGLPGSVVRSAGGPSASDSQVGGDHYRKYKIQPWDIWEEYGLDAFTGAVIKYLLRDKGNRLEDLKKARHTLDKLIEIEEGK